LIYRKKKKIFLVGLCALLLSGCASYRKENAKEINIESSNSKNITINSSLVHDADKEIYGDDTEGTWGLDDIMELFDMR